MIEHFHLDEWRNIAPWINLSQIEQDLVISCTLVNMYERPKIKEALVFRGGTALNKIYFKPAARYSEDIDFVQIKPEPIGKTIDEIRLALDSWLGEPKRKLTERSAKLIYQYNSQENRVMKLKIEINTTEHYHFEELVEHEYSVNSGWFTGKSTLMTYQLNELMGTKLRALYQRRKGRDLFDLWMALKNNMITCEKVIEIFNAYCARENQIITKALFEKNLYDKYQHKDFPYDMEGLIINKNQWSFDEAAIEVQNKLISLLPGDSWKLK